MILNLCIIDTHNVIAMILCIMMKAEVIIVMMIISTIEIVVVIGIAVVALIKLQ